MRVFVIFELAIIVAFLWFVANIIRYLFFKGSPKGGFFGLSDKWLSEENKGGRE